MWFLKLLILGNRSRPTDGDGSGAGAWGCLTVYPAPETARPLRGKSLGIPRLRYVGVEEPDCRAAEGVDRCKKSLSGSTNRKEGYQHAHQR